MGFPFAFSASGQTYSKLPPIVEDDAFEAEEAASSDSSFQGKSPSSFLQKFLLGLTLLFFVALAICPVFLSALRTAYNGPLVQDDAARSKVAPVLGSNSSALQLYFPPVGDEFHPQVASYNAIPEERPRTPLFIGFTRNNEMLRQTILGYISAGWPREDIVIVDNSGTLDANNEGRLSSDNPFYLSYQLYRNRYGVAILQTPTLFNFAQLQNFFLRTSIAHGWSYFFWSHMDVGILGDEDVVPYKSFYERVLDILDASLAPEQDPNRTWSLERMRAATGAWGIKFFEFDNLALVNVEAWRTIGQWDTFIPYYSTDCDAYARLLLHGFTKDNVHAGHIFDLANTTAAPESKFFPPDPASPSHRTPQTDPSSSPSSSSASAPNSPRYRALLAELRALQDLKYSTERNSWQDRQTGGRGEAWTYDPRGFQAAWWDTAQCGRELYTRKWGTLDCRLDGVGLEEMWKGEYAEGREAVGEGAETKSRRRRDEDGDEWMGGAGQRWD